MEEDKEWGEAARDAVAETDLKAAFIASGSSSRAFRPNRVSEARLVRLRSNMRMKPTPSRLQSPVVIIGGGTGNVPPGR